MSLLTSLMRTTTEGTGLVSDTPKHLGWVMLTALGIGATIGAGIFSMPGIIAGKAGPAGILSFTITGFVIMVVAFCYEKFSVRVPNGVSAYSYVYHSLGELIAWIVAFGLFLEYSFGAAAVSIAWGEYLKNAVPAATIKGVLAGPTVVNNAYQFGFNIISFSVVIVVCAILILGGVSKSAKINFLLVLLKLTLLSTFLIVGVKHINPVNWSNFMPHGFKGVMEGAATAVFPFVGFDALYTFARESKSLKDTRMATYWCVGIVAFLYISVMAVCTGLAPCSINGVPNDLFVGTEAAAPLAKLLASVGEGWTSQFISFGAVLGIFNVLLVFCMGGPRIFKNMSEDGLLPPVFQKANKGNPTWGIVLNGLLVASIAALVPFVWIADMMVLGTLVAFICVCIGALKLKLVHPVVAIIGAVSCGILTYNLNPMVLEVYKYSLPVGLVIYFLYGYKHSRLGKAQAAAAVAAAAPDAAPTEATPT
jgi:APA family basic amino acid/polyamine antiporter